MVEKYIKEGKVAILIRGMFGLAWSTINESIQEDLLFNKEYVEMILDNKREDLLNLLNKKYNTLDCKKKKFYFGGVWDLVIQWIPEGELFRIDDYEDTETVVLFSQDKFFRA